MTQSTAQTIAFFALITIAPAAHAVNCIRPVYSENYRDLIQKVSVVDENGRRTEEEYAVSKNRPLNGVQNRFAATGTLECGRLKLSAQLTGANDVITTAAHVFDELATCAKLAEPQSCTFTVKVGEAVRTSKVSSLIAKGTKCPNLPLFSDDWAVLKIDPPLNGVDYYGLPSAAAVDENTEVTAVSSYSRDFVRQDSRGRKTNPKSIEECQIKHVDRTFGPPIYQSNCDNSPGSSGGSLLARTEGRDILLGIHSHSDETPQMLERALRRGQVNSGAFQKGKWANYHVPLTGKFLKAVESATAGQSL